VSTKPREFFQSFFHGTKADLRLGDQIIAGHNSNYGENTQARYVYFTANLNAAVWGAELAVGEGRGRIYVVEPTGPLEADPNLTDKKYPGNPTNSYRTRDPLRVVGEVIGWQAHLPEEIKLRKESLARLLQEGAKIIED
jgi:rifampin ADP-ribosylating transferase